MTRAIAALLALSMASAASAQEAAAAEALQPAVSVVAPQAPETYPSALVIPRDTLIRLMVLNEVNSRRAKPGDRFVLRVDENVSVDGNVVIPVGAKAWGEVTDSRGNGAVGKAGQISAKLLYVEVGGTQIKLSGEERSKGAKGGDRVAMAVMGFGLLGLFAEGAQGKLKAGHIFNGYLADDLLYDPATSSFVVAYPQPVAAATP